MLQSLQPLPAEPEFWAALSMLSVKLYGVPLAVNGEPLGEVLTHLAAGAAGPALVEALASLQGG